MTEQEAFDRCKANLARQVPTFVARVVLPLFVKNGWLPSLEIETDRDVERLLLSMIDHQLLPTIGGFTTTYSSRLEVVILRTERDGVVDFHGSIRVMPDEAVTQVRVT